jgi:hypothetical protein
LPSWGSLWSDQWRGWTICKEFDAFAQTTQKALEKTNESIERTNYNLKEVSKGIEFQKLIDELKFVQQQKAKIKDQYIGKPMPQAVRDALIEKEVKEKELQIKIDNFYKAPLPGHNQRNDADSNSRRLCPSASA